MDGLGTTKYTYSPVGQLLSDDGPFASDIVTNGYSNRLRTRLSLQQPTGFWTLQIVVSAILLGCGDPRNREKSANQRLGLGTSASESSSIVPVLNREQAIEVAKKEAKQRGWNDTREVRCDLKGDKWTVIMESSPEVWGGHAKIEIPTNGGPIRYFGGK